MVSWWKFIFASHIYFLIKMINILFVTDLDFLRYVYNLNCIKLFITNFQEENHNDTHWPLINFTLKKIIFTIYRIWMLHIIRMQRVFGINFAYTEPIKNWKCKVGSLVWYEMQFIILWFATMWDIALYALKIMIYLYM